MVKNNKHKKYITKPKPRDPDLETEKSNTDTNTSTILELKDIKKNYKDEIALNGVSISVKEGEILTLLGPSGCGKTTTLQIIAGIEKPSSGTIYLDNEVVTDGKDKFVPPENRDVGVVFQDFALFPHLNAYENIAFGLKGKTEEQKKSRVNELLDLVGLNDYGDSKPDELSGGQKQRIALARSLAPKPDLLLLDEPFSNLDVGLRIKMREEVRSIIKKTGVTAISVTHDQEEALSISDRVAVMNEGEIKQIGTPEQVFQRPGSRFIAEFLGNASFLSANIKDNKLETSMGMLDLDLLYNKDEASKHNKIDILIRPDDIIAYPVNQKSGVGKISHRRYLGPTILYRIKLKNGDILECMHNHTESIELDEYVDIELAANHKLMWFT